MKIKSYALSQLLHSKLGLTGIAIIVFFVLTAVMAPYIAQTSPSAKFVTGPWAVPEWATVLPPYSGLPPNLEAVNQNLEGWNISGARDTSFDVVRNNGLTIFSSSAGGQSLEDALFVNSSVRYSLSTISGETVINITRGFYYGYRPPYDFQFGVFAYPVSVSNAQDFYFNFILNTPNKTYDLSNYNLMSSSYTVVISYRRGIYLGQWNNVALNNMLPLVNVAALGPSAYAQGNTGQVFFSQKGNYSYTVQLVVIPIQGKTAHVELYLSKPYLFIMGRAYGLMGSDNNGRNLWSQFVYGSRISIEVGLFAAAFTVMIGTFIGMLSAVQGGLLDEFWMRVADVILVIPFLPLAIVVIYVMTQNPIIAKSLYLWLIILFSVLSWPGLARVIRSQSLSLKERGYVEAARALGAGKLYIMNKHLLPNVMGLIYANLALSVPGFILTEASLDFLFPGASQIPTWGRMISKAYEWAASASTYGFGWWWFIFPGLAIVLLSLAFVLLGYALDEIFNPRLRKR